MQAVNEHLEREEAVHAQAPAPLAVYETVLIDLRNSVMAYSLSQISTPANQVPRGVLLGILGGGVPPGSPTPDPIPDRKI